MDILGQIVEAVACDYRIPAKDIIRKANYRAATDARHMVIFVAGKQDEYTEHIAEYFGMTPEAIRYGYRRMRSVIEHVAPVRRRYNRILERLGF